MIIRHFRARHERSFAASLAAVILLQRRAMICLDARDDYTLLHRTRVIAEVSNKHGILQRDPCITCDHTYYIMHIINLLLV